MFEHLLQIFSIPVAFAQKATDAAGDVANQTQDQLTGLVTFLVGQIPLWITAIIVLVASFVLAKVVKSSVENRMTQEGFEEEHKEIQIVAGRTANAAVLLIGITVALKIAGLDLTPIIAAGAFGIGFALQDLIMNFLAGVMILSARHYSIGDIIKVNGTMGKIIEIQTRATVLKAFDGTKIIVPNAELFKNQVTSLTSNPFRRIQLVNGVAYGTDLKMAYNVVMEAVKNTPKVLVMPKPSMFFYEWGDSSINFKVNAWVDTKGGWVKVRNQLIMNIGDAIDKAGIEVPFPTQTILLNKEEGSEPELEKAVKETMIQKAATEAQAMPMVAAATAPMTATVATTPVAAPEPVIETTPVPAQPEAAPAPTPVPAEPVPQQPASVAEQSTPAPVQTEAPIVNPENFDAPDWLKKAMDKNVVTPIGPVPMGELNVQPEPAPAAPAQPYPVPSAFQTAPTPAPVAEATPMPTPAPMQMEQAPAPAPVEQPTPQQPAPVMPTPVPAPTPEQPVAAVSTPTSEIVMPTTI